jgi:hypothetical protein
MKVLIHATLAAMVASASAVIVFEDEDDSQCTITKTGLQLGLNAGCCFQDDCSTALAARVTDTESTVATANTAIATANTAIVALQTSMDAANIAIAQLQTSQAATAASLAVLAASGGVASQAGTIGLYRLDVITDEGGQLTSGADGEGIRTFNVWADIRFKLAGVAVPITTGSVSSEWTQSSDVNAGWSQRATVDGNPDSCYWPSGNTADSTYKGREDSWHMYEVGTSFDMVEFDLGRVCPQYRPSAAVEVHIRQRGHVQCHCRFYHHRAGLQGQDRDAARY